VRRIDHEKEERDGTSHRRLSAAITPPERRSTTGDPRGQHGIVQPALSNSDHAIDLLVIVTTSDTRGLRFSSTHPSGE
jgi:hypothetical protein